MNPPPTISRRSLLLATLATGAAGALTGCSGGSTSSGGGSSNLRFTWWGNAYLNEQTQAVIDAFTRKHADIPVSPEPGEWSSYWEKLATMTAARDAPDVINMDQKYIAEYGGRGALADLRSLEWLDLSTIDPQALAAGTYQDKLYGISTGQNAYSVVANRKVFDDAGVDLPDDKTWTWDDYREIASNIAKKSGGEVYGVGYGVNEAYLIIWLRQHGEQLYTADGKLGYQKPTLSSFFAHLLELMRSGAGPQASAAAEQAGMALEQTAFGTNKAAMTWYWTNQLGSLEATTKSSIVQLRAPSQQGSEADNGMYYKPTMFWSVFAMSKKMQQAAAFVDFLVNDTEAAQILMVDRGAPINSRTRSVIEQKLTAVDKRSLAFLDGLAPTISDAPPVPPMGASDVQNVLSRYVSDVFFEKQTPDQAAETFTTEVSGMIRAS